MKTKTQTKSQAIPLDDFLEIWIQQFIDTKRSEKKSNKTIIFYTRYLKEFAEYCDAHSVKQIGQITTQFIRDYLLYLENRGNNVGGQLIYYRTISTFLNWYWDELEIEEANPIKKVKPPKLEKLALEGVTKDQVELLLSRCERDTFEGTRDAAIISLLYDSGLRAQELMDLEVGHIDLIKGSVNVLAGKGNKSRYTFFGSQTRKKLRRYLRHARSKQWLFTNREGDKLVYFTLRAIVRRRCIQCGITGVGLHDFRRGFALAAVTNNVDLLTLSRLMGHSDLSLLERYVNQNKQNLLDKFQSSMDDLFK